MLIGSKKRTGKSLTKPFYGNSKKKYSEIDGVLGKECSRCHQWKPIDAYGVSRRRWDGRRETCKECRKLSNGTRNEYYREYNGTHKEERRITQLIAREKYDHNGRLKERRNANYRFKLSGNISSLMRTSLLHKHIPNGKSGKHWESIVGYNIADLVNHLESKFKEGMTWENYGYRGWHVDHILPVVSFNYKSVEDEEFKRCWNLENLQPLWAKDNLRKSDKIGG